MRPPPMTRAPTLPTRAPPYRPQVLPSYRPSAPSPINRLHPRLVVPRPLRHSLRRDLLDLLQVAGRELDLERAHVLLEILALLGAGDGHDMVALHQHPRQRELRRHALLPPGDRLD